MVDMAKRVQKKAANLLGSTEVVLAAAVVTPVGQFNKNLVFGGLGGAVGAAAGLAIKGKRVEAETGTLADNWPHQRQSILALTDNRWILFKLRGMMVASPRSIAASWPHGTITGIDIEEAKLASKVAVLFADGSIARVEAPIGSKPDTLVDALEEL